MTNIVKCNECNLVVDELLSFLQNKIDVVNEDTLCQICVSAFSAADIQKSKELLFASIPTDKRNIRRKKAGKEQRNIEDIISLLKGVDPEIIPVFVARDLHKLPPVTFDHVDVTSLLRDIVLLQTAVQDIRRNYATIDQLEDVKNHNNHQYRRNEWIAESNSTLLNNVLAHDLNVNRKRGGYIASPPNVDSGPIGLTHLNLSSYRGTENHQSAVPIEIEPNATGRSVPTVADLKNYVASLSNPASQQECPSHSCQRSCDRNRSTSMQTGEIKKHLPTSIRTRGSDDCTESGNVPLLTDNNERQSSPAETMQDRDPITKSRNTSLQSAQSEHHDQELQSPLSLAEIVKNGVPWKTVGPKTRKIKNHVEGQLGKAAPVPNGRFRAAERKVPILITNVHKDTSESDIVNYIASRTNETVSLQQIQIKNKKKHHNAYKMYVSKFKLGLFLDDKMWPEGIIFRRFVHFGAPKQHNGAIIKN
ncbi:hypothetical protein O0L34_g12177 [Tuta absoluta]|nr:hypothetical protein O0L34_g12177 [Tuta absoluta]